MLIRGVQRLGMERNSTIQSQVERCGRGTKRFLELMRCVYISICWPLEQRYGMDFDWLRGWSLLFHEASPGLGSSANGVDAVLKELSGDRLAILVGTPRLEFALEPHEQRFVVTPLWKSQYHPKPSSERPSHLPASILQCLDVCRLFDIEIYCLGKFYR